MSAPRKEKHLPNCKAKVTSILHFRKRPRNTHYWDEQRSMMDNGGSGHRGFWCLGRIAKSHKDRCSVGSPSRDYQIFFVCLFNHGKRHWQGNPSIYLLNSSSPHYMSLSQKSGVSRDPKGTRTQGHVFTGGSDTKRSERWKTGDTDPMECCQPYSALVLTNCNYARNQCQTWQS